MKLYLMGTEEASGLSEDCCEAHFPLRMEQVRMLRRREDRLRSIAAGALLTAAGIREAEIRFGSCGKPFLPGSSIHFNLSHSGAYACLGVDDRPLGVDVEEIRLRPRLLWEKVLLPEELAWVEQEPESRFIRLWTLKESVMKAVGEGLSLSPGTFSVLPMVTGEKISLSGGNWFGESRQVGDCWLSCVSGRPFSMPGIIRITAEDIRRMA